MPKLGKAFSDSVMLLKSRHNRPHISQLRGWGVRLTLLYLLLIFMTFALVLKLFHLTLIKGADNRQLSEGNRIQTTVIHAPRGILYDRKGISLTQNIPGFRVSLPCEKNVPFCPPKFKSEIEWKKEKTAYKNILYESDYLREYLYGEELSHVLGYLSEITAEEISNPYYKYQDYLLGDRLGRMGLEASLEKDLRGTDGRELVEINANGEKMRTLGKVDAVPGKDINLAIDADLQKVAYDALGDQTGAVIVSKPKTGEVLVLVSKPSFDANKINSGMSQPEYEILAGNPLQPLFNRAISGVYPPGSTFKIIMAGAGLEPGKITKNTTFEDVGVMKIGEFSFANWYFNQYGKTEGNVDILKAIARSNDIFFYKLGETVGISSIAEWGKKFGTGQKSGIEINGEAEGVMPDPVWRKKVTGSDWYLGDTYHVAIGQGEVQATPLQVNIWTNTIAGGGLLCRPTLIKTEGNRVNNCHDLNFKKETIDLITEGMRRACSKDNGWGYQGTGWPFFDFTITRENLSGDAGKAETKQIPVACKTGTAEFGPAGSVLPTHAWFTAFAPLQIKNGDNSISGDPEIAVTVLVEKGGEGSTVAGPIAKKILEAWFKR